MGTWKRNLFSNDTACDIRDTYVNLLRRQYSDEEAYDITCCEYSELMGSEEEPIFWFAMAAAQWQVGRLTPDVKERALFWAEAQGGMELWEGRENEPEKWKKTLLELKKLLLSDMPRKKQFKKERSFETNLWNIGDVYAYQCHKECSKAVGLYGKYILLHKIGEEESYGPMLPRVQIYNRVFDEVPSLDVVSKLAVLPFADAVSYMETCPEDRMALPFHAAIIRYKERDYAPKDFTYIGNIKDTHGFPIAKFNISNCYWSELEECVCEFLPSWREYGYSVQNGEVTVFKM